MSGRKPNNASVNRAQTCETSLVSAGILTGVPNNLCHPDDRQQVQCGRQQQVCNSDPVHFVGFMSSAQYRTFLVDSGPVMPLVRHELFLWTNLPTHARPESSQITTHLSFSGKRSLVGIHSDVAFICRPTRKTHRPQQSVRKEQPACE